VQTIGFPHFTTRDSRASGDGGYVTAYPDPPRTAEILALGRLLWLSPLAFSFPRPLRATVNTSQRMGTDLPMRCWGPTRFGCGWSRVPRVLWAWETS